MKLRLLFSLLFSWTLLFSGGNSSSPDYLPNTLIIKVKDQYRSSCSENGISHPLLQKALGQIETLKIAKEHPHHAPPQNKTNALGIPLVDLSLIYRVDYAGSQDPKSVAGLMMATGFFEYAEPFFLHQLLYNPNDPEIGSQYHLINIQAYQAWDIAKGDTNFVIGITDTGIELAHPDIAANIKHNYNDPIDGIDNDGDGYLDNFNGWDTGENDNNPDWAGVSRHGHSVTGTAAAVTDNGSMVAGVAFNARVMPIKVTNASGLLTGTYTAVVYAADHGCKIINCSWGSVNSWSQYGQDVITYASINKNALVVCAAGNDNDKGIYYPAAFDWALSVGATDINDNKWVSSATKGSNYNEHVDICAPGHDIYTITTTDNGNTIAGRAGTSFSAPVISGAASVAWGQNPSFMGLQIGELLKATADSLEFIPGNGTYAGLLGEGRLNMNRSVTESGFPGFYTYNFSFWDNNTNRFSVGDTVNISGILLNFLTSSSAAAKVVVTSTSPYIKMVDSVVNVGIVNTFGNFDFTGSPFRCVVLPGMPSNTNVGFIFTAVDGTYNTKRYVEQGFNIDYIDVAINQVGTSIGASGKTGYNVLQQNTQGLGFTYKGSSSILYQMGLLLTDNSSKVSAVLDGDFYTQSGLKSENPGFESDFDVYSYFNDDTAGVNKLNVSVKQKTLAWNNPTDEDFVIFEYKIINNSGAAYNNFYAGFYADWDINNYTNNIADFDATTNTAYAYENAGVYAGIHLLTTNTVQHYAYNNDGSSGSVGIYDGYTEAEQISALTSGNSRNSAPNGDVSHLLGNGPYTLASGDSIIFAIAVLAGDNLTDLISNALQADTAYDEIRNIKLSLNTSQNPSCAGFCDGSISITVTDGVGPYTYLWNDPLAQTGATATGLCAGTYSCTVTDTIGNQSVISGLVLNNPGPLSVSLGADTTLCSGATKTLDAGNPGLSYLWSTGATSQSIAVSLANTYSVIVTNGAGCEGKDTIAIFTSSSPTVNLGNDTSICGTASLTLNAGNPGLNYLWSSGATGQTASFSTAGSHWVRVTNFAGCIGRDTLVLTVGTVTSVDLGPDLSNCTGSPVVLDAGNPGANYLWSTGATSQSISVSATGSYHVTVSDALGCSDRDTIIFTAESTPTVSLGNDTSVCRSASFTLDAGNPGSKYVWNTGETSQTISTLLQGQYYVKVGKNCFAYDTINISFLPDPLVWYNSTFGTAYNSNKGNVTLNFGQPSGGTYSGTGVTGNIFNTITAGDGLHKINYHYTDPSSGCVGTTWLVLDVNPTVQSTQLEGGNVLVYPNPFQNFVSIEFNQVNAIENLVCNIYDGSGKLVISEFLGNIWGSNQITIQTATLEPGLYHLVLQNNELYEDFKLVK